MADALPDFGAALAGGEDPAIPSWAHRLAQVTDAQLADHPAAVRAKVFAKMAAAKYRTIKQLGLETEMMSAADAAAAIRQVEVSAEFDRKATAMVHAAAPKAASMPPVGYVRIDRDSATDAVAVTGVNPVSLGFDRTRSVEAALDADAFFRGEIGTGGQWARGAAPSWLQGGDAGPAAEHRVGPVQVFVDGELVFQSDPPEPSPGAAAATAAFAVEAVQSDVSSEVSASRETGPESELDDALDVVDQGSAPER